MTTTISNSVAGNARSWTSSFGAARLQPVKLQEDLSPALTNATVRTWLRHLENKGYLKHRKEGPRFVYSPTWPHQQTQTSALRQVLRTFFGDSPSRAIAALIDLEGDKLTPEEIARLDALLTEAREKGR